MNFSNLKLAVFCINYEGKYYGHEFGTQEMCHFCSIQKNWCPRKLNHQQYF